MIILDTNVVSELMRPNPNPKVFDWFYRLDPSILYTTAVTEAELRRGIEVLPAGRRRQRLFDRMESMLVRFYTESILPFDSDAARAYAIIFAVQRAAGRSVALADCMIAGIARCHGASLATRDLTGFEGSGVHVINPWAG